MALQKRDRKLHQSKWEQPDANRLQLQFSIADSVLEEFILGHGPSAVLTELVQNEYDAQGRRLEVLFGEDSVTVTGNGRVVNRAGWDRLSVVMGTGRVAGTDRRIEAKVNGIGSKNFGLRSLFNYGDTIFVRSGGRQTVLDRHRGTLPKPLRERYSRGRPGIHIEVPYRIRSEGHFEAFSAQKEGMALDQFSRDVMLILVKLADPGSSKSLEEVVVYSKRCGRRLVWKQSVSDITSSSTQKFKILRRTATMRDSGRPGIASARTKKLEEIEFQKNLRVPEEFKQHMIPDYFRTTGGRIRLTLSLRLKKGKVDVSEPGLFYYPLGLIHAHTGTAVSVNAPFQLDDDRTRIIDTVNSAWNGWLLRKAAEFTLELLRADWAERFGHQAYLALSKVNHPAMTEYLDSVTHYLQEEQCWPTHAHSRGRIIFASAEHIVIPVGENLDGFLRNDRYLDDRFSEISDIQDMVFKCGARSFTVNSLVRLRCFGRDRSAMTTKLEPSEADIAYIPDTIQKEWLQVKFGVALDSNRRKLSKQNRHDLSHSATTLTEEGGLQAPVRPLWTVDPTVEQVCPVPKSQRLHHSLMFSKTLQGLCKEFDVVEWARHTAERISQGDFDGEDRAALYRYILSVHGRFKSRTRAVVRRAPVLKNHRDEWVAPCKIMAKRTAIGRQLEPVLDFPHRDYAKDTELAKALSFKQKVDGADLIACAKTMQQYPEHADGFEGTLQGLRKILTRPIIAQLHAIPFLRRCKEAGGGVSTPKDLYLRNQLNCVCLGDTAPYVDGSRSALYKLLGCRETPEADDIKNNLQRLSGTNQKPEKLEVIYTTLVEALRAERSPSSLYSQTPIIWNGSSYSSPEATILGSRYRKMFLDAVPCISVPSPRLREAFVSLGVSQEPLESHWRQLLVWFGDEYGEAGLSLPEKERSVLKNAYSRMHKIPDGLDYDVKCFLDRNGKLHSRIDIQQEKLLIDDDPPTAQAMFSQAIPLSFVDASEHGNYLFFRSAGVKPLTEVRNRKHAEIGAQDQPPHWFKHGSVLEQLHSSAFCSAILTVAEHESSIFAGRMSLDSACFQEGLKAIEHISFTKEIRSKYEIHGYSVDVSEEFLLDGKSIVLARVRSRNDLHRLLARAIASMLSNDVTKQRTLGDSIYILLTCQSVSEIEKYLKGKGIPWRHKQHTTESWEDAEEKQDDYDPATEDIINATLEAMRSAVAESGKSHSDGSNGELKTKPEESKEKESKPLTGKPLSLPPLKKLKIRRLKPNESWVPTVTTDGGKRGPYIWAPSGASDDERDKLVGERGEEIIYHDEIVRVRGLGYPESRVVWVAHEIPGADYDILSVDDDGENLWIEVKATTGRHGRFRWPIAEFGKAIEKRNRYILWRVYEADSLSPAVKLFRDPIEILLRKGMRLDINTFNAMIEPM